MPRQRVTVLHYDDKVGNGNFQTVAEALKKFGAAPASVAIKRNADVPAPRRSSTRTRTCC